MFIKTLYQKLWGAHVVHQESDGSALLYIDRHLVHEVTSPQAFEALKIAKREIWNKGSIVAVPDHNVPTTEREKGITDEVARIQVETLNNNCEEYGLTEFKMNDIRQGIVHVIGPEQGVTLPGMTVVCGDSHTSTHGAFGALAFGIGTSEVEHVLATQCLVMKNSKTMNIVVDGETPKGVTGKDIILIIIGKIGTAGGTGYAIEFSGKAIRDLSVEGRMSLCNMAIEAGAQSGLVAVDDKTISYFKGKAFAPKGDNWLKAEKYWRTLKSDKNAIFDKTISLNVENFMPQVTWGTSPEMVVNINGRVPDPAKEKDNVKASAIEKAIDYMGLEANQSITDINVDKVFIGSCTNSRIEDLRDAAAVVEGKKAADNIKSVLVVPGSGLVKQQAEKEGLDKIFINAGFEWREPGCSMCLAMNADRLEPEERCASTSNRNFEGRQGAKSRTHLVSPAMAAAAAIKGHFVDFRKI